MLLATLSWFTGMPLKLLFYCVSTKFYHSVLFHLPEIQR